MSNIRKYVFKIFKLLKTNYTDKRSAKNKILDQNSTFNKLKTNKLRKKDGVYPLTTGMAHFWNTFFNVMRKIISGFFLKMKIVALYICL